MPQIPRDKRLAVYSFLSRRRGPKSFSGKILLVAFVGTHVPLLTLFVYAVASTDLDAGEKTSILLVALVATLVGTGLTLYALNQLLSPISITYQALRKYLTQSAVPELPTQYTDEAGRLMADTRIVIRRLDDAIHRMANYDPLTALPNRNLFQASVGQVIQGQGHDRLAVLAIDLVGFELVHSGLGTDEGNAILTGVAERLSVLARGEDVLARIGDQMFALLITGFDALEGIEARATEMLSVLAHPLAAGKSEVRIHGAVGIALYPNDEQDALQLLVCAESALLTAKKRGADEVAYFSVETNVALRRRLAIEAALEGALERDELELLFQPLVQVREGRIMAAEALLRWNSTDLGPVSPLEFIPVSESTGHIVQVGEWVLRTACRQAQKWQSEGHPPFKISVNVSAKQLQSAGFAKVVAKVLKESGFEPKLLQLEVTESALMEDIETAGAVLRELQAAGVGIALDDFGTGYSSLSYLKRLPINVLKIDRSFVRGLPEDGHDRAIVRSVMAMADSLGLGVVAEGVETPEQARCLLDHGCSSLQGYFFGKPVSARDLTERLVNRAASLSPVAL